MFMKSKLRTREEKRESVKLMAGSIGLGVILIILDQVLSEIFETPAFFGMTIMLLSIILVNLTYLVEIKIREERRREQSEA